MQEDEVHPGEIGTFTLHLVAPDAPGYYQEYFTPVVENITWMADTGLYFDTIVFGGKYAAQFDSQSSLNQWKRGKSYVIWMKLRNLGQETWTKKNMTVDFLKEQDLKISNAKLMNDEVEPGELGEIQFTATVDENEDLETKALLLRPKVDGIALVNRPIYFYYTVLENGPVEIPKIVRPTSGVTNPQIMTNTGLSETEKKIRIKISFEGDPQITANGNYEVWSGDQMLGSQSSGHLTKISLVDGKYKIQINGNTYTKSDPVRFGLKSGTALEIDNYDNPSSWNPEIMYNQYRGVLEVREVDGKLVVINELPLESYLKGLAEVPNDEEYEKMKAILVAARSYARFYITEAQKFEGKPYHLDDDPNVSQKYLGYAFEVLTPIISKAVDETRGQVVTYNGELVKTPYFSQSDGEWTKSALDVWNWDAPFLVSVNDSYCDSTEFWGHGVGMSGCGARGMAEAGFNYVSILKHYYTGIEIADLY